MPSRSGVPSAGSPPRFMTFSFSSMKRKRSTCSSTNEQLPRGSREPTDDKAGVVAEGELLRIELDVPGLRWKLGAKSLIAIEYRPTSRHLHVSPVVAQPVAYCSNRISRFVVVRANVLASNIGAEVAKAIALAIQYQAVLLAIPRLAITSCTEEEPQLQRHVESSQPSSPVQSGS